MTTTTTKKKTTKKAAVKKTATKKTATKKPATKKETTTVSRPRLEKTEDGRSKELRQPQVRVLEALVATPDGCLTRKALSSVCPGLTEMVGPIRDTAPNKYTVSLVEHGFVKYEKREEDGIVVVITASGRKAIPTT